MRILFIGDIVGRSGRAIVLERLPRLMRDWKLDFVAINGENAAGGFGITEAIYQEFVDAGADVDHAAATIPGTRRRRWSSSSARRRLLRPINFPPARPAAASALIEAKNGARVLVVNAMGRIFMDPLDDPFAAVERELAACPLERGADAIIVDIHGEATSEKQAMGHFCDGRASLVVGTHTHVPTADHQILPRRHRLHVRRRHDRRLQFGDRHGQGRAAERASCARFRAPASSRRWGRRRCARSRSRPTMRPGLPAASPRCGSAAGWKRRGRRSGAELPPPMKTFRRA